MSETIEALLDRADEYARFAVENLMLEEPLDETENIFPGETEAGLDPKIVAGLKSIARDEPLEFLWAKREHELKVHYLFPNLSERERQAVALLRISKRDKDTNDYWRETFVAISNEVAKFERKFSAIQIALIDSAPNLRF